MVNADATGPITYTFDFQSLVSDGGTASGTLTGTSVGVFHNFVYDPFVRPRYRTVTFTVTGPGPDNTDSATCTVIPGRDGGGGGGGSPGGY